MTSFSQALNDYFSEVKQAANDVEIDFLELENELNRFQVAAAAAKPSKADYLERFLLSPEGLPNRPFFKSFLQAPGSKVFLFFLAQFFAGVNLGYGALVFPGISQALLDRNYTLAQTQVRVLSLLIANASSWLLN
jgi:hypothetical protein